MRVFTFVSMLISALLTLSVAILAETPEQHLTFLPVVYYQGDGTPIAVPITIDDPTQTSEATLPSTAIAIDTPSPTHSPTLPPMTTVAATVAATAAPTLALTPIPTPTAIKGDNLQCRQTGAAEICAWVSEEAPPQQSIVTLNGRLLVDGTGLPSEHMISQWHFANRTSECDSGFTSYDGVARCSRGIGRAEPGFEVEIQVSIGGYTVTTAFTPISN